MQLQIWKKVREKGPSTIVFKTVWFTSKKNFFGELISIWFIFRKLFFRKTDFYHCSNLWKSVRPTKNVFFPFSCFCSFSFDHLLSRRFLLHRRRESSLCYMFSTLSKENLKHLYHDTVISSKQNQIYMKCKWNLKIILYLFTQPYLMCTIPWVATKELWW